MTLSFEKDFEITQNIAKRFHRLALAHKTSEQVQDVIQNAWVIKLEQKARGIPGEYLPKRTRWGLIRKYTETEKVRSATYTTVYETWEDNEDEEDCKSPLPILDLKSLTGLETQYLYQNIWAIGTPGGIAVMQARLHGNYTDFQRHPFQRARVNLQKTFSSITALLGPSKIRWYHPNVQRDLVALHAGKTPVDTDYKEFIYRQYDLMTREDWKKCKHTVSNQKTYQKGKK